MDVVGSQVGAEESKRVEFLLKLACCCNEFKVSKVQAISNPHLNARFEKKAKVSGASVSLFCCCSTLSFFFWLPIRSLFLFLSLV